MNKLTSLSIFFPFLNDGGTVRTQIENAYKIGRLVTDDLEVIAINGGQSKDDTYEQILHMKTLYPDLMVINKHDNKEGYAVIKHGLKNASKDWVFYTDGDAQYHLEKDLVKLVDKQASTKADVVNGYKRHRGDTQLRTSMGNIYKTLSSNIFRLPIRDTDCDFRLIRKTFLDKISLESTDASILPELIKKLEIAGAKFSEIEVAHYQRIYGKSNYNVLSLLKEKLIGDIKLYLKMRKFKLL